MQANEKSADTKKKAPEKILSIDDLMQWREAHGLQGPFSPNVYPLIDSMRHLRQFKADHPLSEKDTILVFTSARVGTHPERGDVPFIVHKCEGDPKDLVKLVYRALHDHPQLIPVFREALARIQQDGAFTLFESLAEVFTKKAQEGKHANH